MKYFTTELDERLNSSDDAIVTQASEQWERAVLAYDRRLKTILSKLPPSLKRFVGTLNLHDAEVMAVPHGVGTSLPGNGVSAGHRGRIQRFCSFNLRLDDKFVVLVYGGISNAKGIQKLAQSVHHHNETILWLYDEVDLASSGMFSHRILFSNGESVELVFRQFALAELNQKQPVTKSHRKSAARKRKGTRARN